METTLIAELAWAVTRAGHPTLRFNYRGVGASPGRFTEEHAYEDLLKAAHHLRACIADGEEALPPLALLGIGLGANLAVRLAQAADFTASPLILLGPDAPAQTQGVRGEVVVLDPAQHSLRDLGKIVAETVSLGGRWKATEGGAR
jgi:alpha/beta superfamily hydrolase